MNKLDKSKNFRLDINGLRAWAVVAVVLFHFKIAGFEGGFVGVDVFFVISGFLMAGIILRVVTPAEKPVSAVLRFYLARGIRIVPPLVVMCSFLVILGWFFLAPLDYRQLGIQSATAVTFLSNFKFWLEAGYFDSSAHEKWLLHTWSLSVEWQFYLLLPLLLVSIRRFQSRTMTILLGSLCFASLFCSVYVSHKSPSLAFFLLPTRAWEMLAGCLLYIHADSLQWDARMRRMVEAFGLGLIFFSVLIFDSSSIWPGANALVPVVGTLFVLAASRQTSFFTSNRLAQLLGSASYSIYLWHWPIVVALHYTGLMDSISAVFFGLVGSVVLGQLSYLLVERGSRGRNGSGRVVLQTSSTFGSAFVVASVASAIVLMGGVPNRIPERVRAASNVDFSTSAYREGTCFLRPEQPVSELSDCVERNSMSSLVLLWGDSHGAHLYPAFQKTVASRHSFEQLTASACPPIINVDFPLRPNCRGFNDEVKHRIKLSSPSIVVLAANWYDHKWADVHSTVEWLRTQGITRIYLVGPVPRWSTKLPSNIVRFAWRGPGAGAVVPERMSYGLSAGGAELDAEMRAAAADWQVNYLSPYARLCDESGCLALVDDGNGLTVTTWDQSHLTVAGSQYLAPLFANLH